ncbi:hypothetical protein IAT40_004624 [Kwoniella sp. CBS 6097]
MSGTQQAANGNTLSAFNALGSYAGRIKDADGNLIQPSTTRTSIATSTSSPASASASLPKGNGIGNSNPEPSAASSSSTTPTSTMTKSRGEPKPAAVSAPTATATPSTKAVQPANSQQAHAEDDGPWETVQSARQRNRPDEKDKHSHGHGSNSKNWRDRSHRDGQGQKERQGDESEKDGKDGKERRSGGGKSSKKGGNTPAPSTSAPPAAEKPALPTAVSNGPAKPAWGALSQPSKSTAAAPATASPIPTPTQGSKAATQPQGITAPSSPSLNGTTVTANSVSVPASIGSPNPSSDNASTSTASASVLSKAVDKLEEDGSWRARPKVEAETEAEEVPAPTQPTQPAPPRQAAPPPAVNAWDLRKKKMTPASNAASQTKQGASAMQNGPSSAKAESGQKSLTNGHLKEENAKTSAKKKSPARSAASTVVLPSINDSTLWPDVSQAAEAAKATEDKKEKPKEKAESAAATEEVAGSGKKPRWTPIPAAELLAAADHAAEQNRRQSRLEASAKKRLSTTKGEGESLAAGAKGAKPRKGGAPPVPAVDAKKVNTRAGPAGSVSESKAPSVIPGQGGDGEAKVSGENGQGAADKQAKADVVNGDSTAPLSRQTSRQSKSGSPTKSQTQLPTSNSDSTHLRFGSGPLQSRPMTGSNTAPLPQQGFQPGSSATLPRARGRDGRGSFNGRGRGGFRSNSAIPHKGQGYASPPSGMSGLPADGATFANGGQYQRGFMGFQPFYPVGYGPQGIYDPSQAQYGVVYRAGLPPPPMPQTVVPNLDAMRFYVLGQIEYYFSMQNLAMDFFLRQQMDSEGWIDISMIASFNRLKSLTPDVSIIRECMALSSLLEVREDQVRLAGLDANRWVLPDAKPSKFGPDPTSPSQATEESRDVSLGIPASVEQSLALASSEDGLQSVQVPPPTQRSFVAAEVENALMKSSAQSVAASASATASAAPVSASTGTSVANGEGTEVGTATGTGTEAATPATSTSGDAEVKEEEEVEQSEAVKE